MTGSSAKWSATIQLGRRIDDIEMLYTDSWGNLLWGVEQPDGGIAPDEGSARARRVVDVIEGGTQ
jgi:hypothetical protein